MNVFLHEYKMIGLEIISLPYLTVPSYEMPQECKSNHLNDHLGSPVSHLRFFGPEEVRGPR